MSVREKLLRARVCLCVVTVCVCVCVFSQCPPCQSTGCPSNCTGNGLCTTNGVCSCFPGYTGADCSLASECAGGIQYIHQYNATYNATECCNGTLTVPSGGSMNQVQPLRARRVCVCLCVRARPPST